MALIFSLTFNPFKLGILDLEVTLPVIKLELCSLKIRKEGVFSFRT
jgi:hypothetical protein